MNQVETLRHHIATAITAMGYEYVGCEWHKQGRYTLLRIYIDKAAGVNLDDCTLVSRQISALLDVEDPIPGQYTLEVSSPGIDRPLFELKDYQKQIGKKLKVRVVAPIDNKRNFVGILSSIADGNLHLRVDEMEIVVPFSVVEKANVIADCW